MTSFLASALAAFLLAGSSAAPHYRAETAKPAAERIIVHGLVWRCGGAACVTGSSNSRPLVDCQALARTAGALTGFAVDGNALPADQLEKCNAAAR
jgi:hypothetical protein